jgi:hypothetical protein
MIALSHNVMVESSILVWSRLNNTTEPERNKSGIEANGLASSTYARVPFPPFSIGQIIDEVLGGLCKSCIRRTTRASERSQCINATYTTITTSNK